MSAVYVLNLSCKIFFCKDFHHKDLNASFMLTKESQNFPYTTIRTQSFPNQRKQKKNIMNNDPFKMSYLVNRR